MIECPSCRERNEGKVEFCRKCRSDLLPGVTPGERVRLLTIGLLVFVCGSLVSWFIANLMLIGSWAFATSTSKAPETPSFLYFAGLGLFAATIFETGRRMKFALSSTPQSIRYLQRAKRHMEIDPNQSITDLISALEILGTPRHSSTFLEISGLTMPKDVRLCFDAYSLRAEIGGELVSSGLMASLDQLLVKVLLPILSDPRDDISLRTATYLTEMGDPVAVKPVLDRLRRGWNDTLTSDRASRLAHFGPAAVPALVATLEASDWGAKIIVVETLMRVSDPTSTEAVTKLLSDKEWAVRRAAAQGLGELGDSKAVEPLSKLLEGEKKKEVISTAKEALEKLGRRLT